MEQRADDDEVRAAIDDRLRTLLPAALDDVVAACAPPDIEELMVEIGAATSLFGGDWTQNARVEFIEQATRMLSNLPRVMVLDAIARAKRHIHSGKLFVPWICQDVDPRASALRTEHDRLHRLADLAGIGG